MESIRHTVLIVGGGAGGLTVAALLKRAQPTLDVAVIEPSAEHYYQPGWTLVGAGVFDAAVTRRETARYVPEGVSWIKDRVTQLDPAANQVTTASGAIVGYQFLVMAAGLQINWGQIAGLEQTLGQNGVSSNYRFDLAPYTWECISRLRGGKALFTQPVMPIKCAGAPQKIMYMAADHWRRQGVTAEVHFFNPGAAMFGVPFYSQALEKVVAHYGVHKHFGHTLVAVDGERRRATFETTVGEAKQRNEVDFDFLHVVPPQSAPDFIRQSPLADAAGWVSVDKHQLRHTQYENVFGLGDCTTTPNSKTAAAVRAQAPVLVGNLLQAQAGQPLTHRYDGYASCPITTSKGRIMLAEFLYDGVVSPSLPLDPRIPRRGYWAMKKYYFPWLYWQMLTGDLGPDWHRVRKFPEAVPPLAP